MIPEARSMRRYPHFHIIKGCTFGEQKVVHSSLTCKSKTYVIKAGYKILFIVRTSEWWFPGKRKIDTSNLHKSSSTDEAEA